MKLTHDRLRHSRQRLPRFGWIKLVALLLALFLVLIAMWQLSRVADEEPAPPEASAAP